ncbi:LysM peptidoglycan-binding domain-containing protein [Desulfosporosinus youngiae]|uniref:LysM domain-containing protein n=1 Tax=Desulfosporosinus youngiae DSM 17734 TaxID=768710 RepID=H5Y0B2_9FIRM|nr:LysM peptidoglycan-binding domain-containing protein [Desulfosporosinus youngiae]EHQ92091.1 LysM domain-containing protein [Desulfosporosinus youngiae DSM 17734]
MSYGINLSFNNTESIQLPVMPGSFEIGEGGKNKTYDVLELGEINVIKNLKLSEYAFSSFFPAQPYPFVTVQPLLKPYEYVKLILKWMEAKQPIRFIVISDAFDIDTLASIEGFDWKEEAGRSGDIDYSLKLKKYVPYSARRAVSISTLETATASTQTIQAPERPNEQQTPKTYTLAAGDTLWSVAQKLLGGGARWPELQSLNGISDAEIKRLQIGRVLKLP